MLSRRGRIEGSGGRSGRALEGAETILAGVEEGSGQQACEVPLGLRPQDNYLGACPQADQVTWLSRKLPKTLGVLEDSKAHEEEGR